MCGFAALFEAGRTFPDNLIQAIDRDLYHRGPNSGGSYVEPGLALVFRRLAILDPEARSDQPFWDKSRRYVLLFNGEIYNYKSLRSALAAEGVTFCTSGDTEAIVEGFAHWGERIFERLEGMFALMLVDTKERVAFAARDPFGIKPLYITRSGPFFGAASEMRPLRRATGRTEVDPEALSELVLFRFAAGRHSNLKGIEMLPGGTLARFSLAGGGYRETRFADPLDTIEPDDSIGPDEALRMADEALSTSVEAHLQSDVGYSLQLSGGVDSSLILALATEKEGHEVESYSVRMLGTRFDESEYRAPIIERYRPVHHEIDIGPEQFTEALPKAIRHMEGPSAHMGCVMLMLLCEQIGKTHRVVLTGEGADELFGGYAWYGQWRRLRLFGQLAPLVPGPLWPLLSRYSYVKRFSRYEPPVISSVFTDLDNLQTVFPHMMPKPGAREAASRRFSDFRDKLLAVDQSSYLSSHLLRQDKMSMAASVEARVPFTHYPLAKVINRLPRQVRIRDGETKPLLKQIARKWLPAEVVDRRKVGLNLPIRVWLEDATGFGRYLELLTEPNSRINAYADRHALLKLVERFRRGETLPTFQVLAQSINIELWLRSLEQDGITSALSSTAA